MSIKKKEGLSHKVTLENISLQISSLEKKISRFEKKIIEEDKKIEAGEEAELAELQKLEELERKLERDIHVSPLKKVTLRDFSKSMIGAFFGVLGHFAFYYGVNISENISVMRATMLYIVAFIVGFLFLYYAGFKNVRRSTIFYFMPLRLFVIYTTSIMTIIVVLFLFGFIGVEKGFIEIYKLVATISILAVMGAAAADLIGKEPE